MTRATIYLDPEANPRGMHTHAWRCPCGAVEETWRYKKTLGRRRVPSKCYRCGVVYGVDVPSLEWARVSSASATARSTCAPSGLTAGPS